MRRIHHMNISFAKLGEECERCEMLKQKPHQKEGALILVKPVRIQPCTNISQLKLRAAYKAGEENTTPGRIARSIDLQKVIMFPRLPGFKSSVLHSAVSRISSHFCTRACLLKR